MDFKRAKKLLAILIFFYFGLMLMIFVISGDEFQRETVVGNMISPSTVIGEIVDGMVVQQKIKINSDCIEGVNLLTATYGKQSTGVLHIDLYSQSGELLISLQGNVADMIDNHVMRFNFDEGIRDMKEQFATMQIWTEGCYPGNAVTIYYGNSVNAGRFEITKQFSAEELYSINGINGTGMLCAYFNGYNDLGIYKLYWPCVCSVFLAVAIAVCFWWKQAKQGKENPLTAICKMVLDYGFLIRQLVGRDFKTKYKRSMLGIGWSVLNPLLTMTVQYIVFSTLFGNGTKNYPVYLLIGIVFFNFFNEAINMGMTSITGNAALIKKVYMPKYIYPISRVFSSLINLGTSMIPLFVVMLLTGLLPKISALLLIYDVFCFLLFVIGMVLILSTCMTFFQDTLFLWGVASMIWMYLTPIFYTESIIPEKFITIYRMNPLYQFISFARTCIIDGISPAPEKYLWCLLTSSIVLTIGIIVFRKNQNKFVLYL